jgi:hypothetical protein
MRRVSRLEQASQLHQATAGVEAGRSEREMVRELGVARSSLRDWQRRAEQTPAPAALVAFAESAEGVQWLHRQVMAMHFVITLLAGAGVRLVCEYLELSGLSAFVASSYGAQQQISVALEEAVVASGEQQRAELGPGMPRRQVTVCEDETFHPEICLVGLEPVSNFILLEQYAQNRSAATWTPGGVLLKYRPGIYDLYIVPKFLDPCHALTSNECLFVTCRSDNKPKTNFS